MNVADIEDALEDKNLPGIEAAFRLLIEWPQGQAVEGAEDADELSALMDRVTAALEADRKPMPPDLAAAIVNNAGDAAWLQDDRSYAAGARAVAARNLRWRSFFAFRLGAGEADPALDPYEAG